MNLLIIMASPSGIRDVINDKVPALEVLNAEIFRFPDGIRMFAKAAE